MDPVIQKIDEAMLLILLRMVRSRGWTDHLETRHCPRARDAPWYLFHRLF
ncbi:unnamed protein product [Staurois parvus]|uniref:Uncharacterized protein n=1 Tax=Staurois parvus TaxID=386267 RepID=A0ABN9D3F5_9NEOB|nr:unnamed protein product [Staurois parvus]